ncbi:hypothetical protein [Archaeoglobus profundus]|uniref:Uncharacterized protein n=1 Tax=Archaeoglobus profundus (strain DSM 5631 / JCM 9629 / NBRC 100127 / Av18) TaxID=572546 RepID=D2RI42_ARCPA|nr:hypothetical protein [Archaeoglobus profundus]ADB57967.1 hypothetical protein Arcpr_0906 [Archaeoglobus profundus DSM 5631]
MVVVSLEKEKEKKNLFEVEEVVKELKRKEKSLFLQKFCKCYEIEEVVTTLINIKEVYENGI